MPVRNANRRLDRAMRARDERLAKAWLKANPPPTCPGPGCGRPLPTVLPGTVKGRARVWCSDACRQRAYRARKKSGPTGPTEDAKPAAVPADAATPADAPVAHTVGDCIIAVLESPYAVTEVLDAVRRADSDGVLERPEYADVRVALIALVESMRAAPE